MFGTGLRFTVVLLSHICTFAFDDFYPKVRNNICEMKAVVEELSENT